MVRQAREELPSECCGLLAGTIERRRARVVKRYALVNRKASPVAYEAEAAGLFAAFKEMRRLGLVELAFYHSHPTSPPIPSKTDLACAFWPHTVTLIISLAGDKPDVQGWWLTEESYSPARWKVLG
jgi:proteasome lid subunit RPN8/RPN11